MEFSLDDNRAGAGSSILLSPEVVAIRAKLIEACDGKTFAETMFPNLPFSIISLTLETIELCLRWYPISNGVLFFLERSIIFFADLILSEIGFSNKTGIFFFKKLTVCFS
mgnify:CR=1 FL=1